MQGRLKAVGARQQWQQVGAGNDATCWVTQRPQSSRRFGLGGHQNAAAQPSFCQHCG